jgi:phosphoribosylformimino-5-aminoimidazole carboxamide ribotide isomerase
MQIIPVIDLLNGVVVHAQQGQRQHYQAIKSQLTHSSKPLDIVAALIDIYPFKSLYIADLNRIQKISDRDFAHLQLIETINKHYSELEIWLDAGFNDADDFNVWRNLNIKPIIGSENFRNIAHYETLVDAINQPFCLSLDFMPDGFLGNQSFLENPILWPEEVITMALASVGTSMGPNFTLLESIYKKKPSTKIYAAGGIRNLSDIKQLKEMKINGALIATALHQRKITSEDLSRI